MGTLGSILLIMEGVRTRSIKDALRTVFRALQIKWNAVKPNKNAFLVLGPESHGTHLLTDLLINAGCIGHAGNHVPWQPNNKELLRGVKKPWQFKFPTDLQPWDKKMPFDEDPIVWRRSIPHGKEWINISSMITLLRSRGYKVKVLVMTRDAHSGLQSQLKWRHVRDEKTGKININKAYLHIFKHLMYTKTPYVLVSYESLAFYPKAQDHLLSNLGLPLPKRRWPIYDGNRKWHDLAPEEIQANFPEAWYPCQVGAVDKYFSLVEEGYKQMEQLEVVICGLARNIGESLPRMMPRIEKLGRQFKNYKVVIFENDSNDGTLQMLEYWQKTNPKVKVLSKKLDSPQWGQVQDLERTEKMAEFRNHYLDHIKKEQYAFDYLLIMDLDIPLGFSYDGIAHSFSHSNWDVMASNGILVPPYGDPIPNPIFYDAFAYRPKHIAQEMDIQSINALQFQRGEDLVPVQSAFGGLAIYRSDAVLSGASYGGEDCEHVVFHQRLREKGFGQIFLNPNQLVLYSGKS